MVRVTVWMRLLKRWASMRFDDLMWLDPDSVLMSEARLEGTMSQSKTLNKLKKADAMKVFVSATACISETTWLMDAEKNWRGACGGSMFMFPLPSADLESVKEKPVRYREASALSQALLASLTCQDGGCAGEKGEGILLLPEGAGVFYTEHSERNAMISFAAALGIQRFCRRGSGGLGATAPSSTYGRPKCTKVDLEGKSLQEEQELTGLK